MAILLAIKTFLFGSSILTKLIELGTVLLSTLLSFVSWYLGEFWKGLGVIFNNLSTLTVILAIIIGSGWYFKSWDNDKVLQECIKTCPTPVVKKTYTNSLKKKIFGDTTKKILTKPKPQETRTFNPFEGN